MSGIFAEDIFLLFLIMATGYALGQVKVRGISLGTAGVLFTALVFGHLGYKVPKEIMDLGLVLFVYAVGLQAGPRFFRTFKKTGLRFVLIGLVTVTTGALLTVAVAYLLKIPFDLACGLYTGAMTCTPALAAAMDSMGRLAPGHGANVSVGYGIAYPFSMIGVVLLIQILPGLLRRDLAHEEAAYKLELQADQPKIHVRTYRISNPNCDGISLAQLNPRRMSGANITRVRRGEKVFMASPETLLNQGDLVMATGPLDELDKMRILLGEETQVPMDLNTNIVSVAADVTEGSLAGKTIGDLHIWSRYGVVITRILRQDMELTPSGKAALDMGDTLIVVGEREAVDEFAKVVDPGKGKADQTNMLPFLIGLVLGIGVGSIPFTFSNGLEVKLGVTGGAFVFSLLLGHFGRIGSLRLYVPQAAKNFSRELGLMLFLAGAGTVAGERFVSVLQREGWRLFGAGALVTGVSVAAGLFIMFKVFRMNLLSSMGALCACMTNPPGLGAASAQTASDQPALAYASVYPVALIFKIVIAQILVGILGALLQG